MVNAHKIIVIILTIFSFNRASHSLDTQTATHPEGNRAPEIAKLKPILKKTFEFPKQSEALNAAINDGCAEIEIYIPTFLRNGEQAVDEISLEHSSDLSHLQTLIIKHSLRSDRGHWIPAVEALLPLIKGAKGLKEVTLTHVLLDQILPHLPPGIKIQLECSCCYKSTDTVKPLEELTLFANAQLEFYREKYPTYDINIVPIPAIPFENYLRSF